MTVTINGVSQQIAPGITVTQLLEAIGLDPRLIVVEYNRDILDRSVFGATELKAGDSLELVHFVGGG